MFYKALAGQVIKTKKYGDLEAKKYKTIWYFDVEELPKDVKDYFLKLVKSRNDADIFKNEDVYTPFTDLEKEIERLDKLKVKKEVAKPVAKLEKE